MEHMIACIYIFKGNVIVAMQNSNKREKSFTGKEVEQTGRDEITLQTLPYHEGRYELGEWKSDLPAEVSQSFMIDCFLLTTEIYLRVERMA